MKRLFIITLFAVVAYGVAAQDNTITVTAPDRVDEWETFSVSYAIRRDLPGGDARLEGSGPFEVLLGPTFTRSTSSRVINGERQSTTTTTYTCLLIAKSSGNFPLPRLSLEVDGKRILSPARGITVAAIGAVNGGDFILPGEGPDGQGQDTFLRVEASGSGGTCTFSVVAYSVNEIFSVKELRRPDFDGLEVYNDRFDDLIFSGVVQIGGRDYRKYLARHYTLESAGDGSVHIGEGRYRILEGEPGGQDPALRWSVELTSPAVVVEVGRAAPLPTEKEDLSGSDTARAEGEQTAYPPKTMAGLLEEIPESVVYILSGLLMLVTVLYLRQVTRRRRLAEERRPGHPAAAPSPGRLWHIPYLIVIGLLLASILILSGPQSNGEGTGETPVRQTVPEDMYDADR